MGQQGQRHCSTYKLVVSACVDSNLLLKPKILEACATVCTTKDCGNFMRGHCPLDKLYLSGLSKEIVRSLQHSERMAAIRPESRAPDTEVRSFPPTRLWNFENQSRCRFFFMNFGRQPLLYSGVHS